ncbi:hypothetical protein [Parasphingorhabdus cellanae]|uniref:Tyr recombinase domain-containing protein n=1 Tax=Parasphingorhabdus cellanae TaxID=2806553 RepID=A0ABX7T8K0_9SPHN|nr:hypothetical protein [Parasphingorhabdus cellanae]QTD57949.1 hypothetical protein J4G78_07970 [Parasphingorhabdus cellanae]
MCDAIRLVLLTGFRRTEALGLKHDWIDEKSNCVYFPSTKTGNQIRVISSHAIALIKAQPIIGDNPRMFTGERGDGHFVGIPRVLKRLSVETKSRVLPPIGCVTVSHQSPLNWDIPS